MTSGRELDAASCARYPFLALQTHSPLFYTLLCALRTTRVDGLQRGSMSFGFLSCLANGKPCGDGGRKEFEVRVFTFLVLTHCHLCPLLEGSYLVLGSGTLSLCPSLWAYGNGSSAAMSSGHLDCSSGFLISCPHLCNKHI